MAGMGGGGGGGADAGGGMAAGMDGGKNSAVCVINAQGIIQMVNKVGAGGWWLWPGGSRVQDRMLDSAQGCVPRTSPTTGRHAVTLIDEAPTPTLTVSMANHP